jgi:hypothetical protein
VSGVNPVESAVDVVRLTGILARQRDRLAVIGPPLALLVAAYFASLMAAPSLHSGYESFFGTAAEVLGTILVGLILQASLFAEPGVRPAAVLGIAYIVLGEAAAVAALLPGDTSELRRQAFAFTVSAGVGSLAAVVFIAIRLLSPPPVELSEGSDDNVVLEDPVDEAPEEAPVIERPVDRRAEFRRAPKERQRRSPGARPNIELSPRAVEDLTALGNFNGRLTAHTIQAVVGRHGAEKARPIPDHEGWYQMTLGGLAVILRKSPDGVMIKRIVRAEELKRPLEELVGGAATGPPAEP